MELGSRRRFAQLESTPAWTELMVKLDPGENDASPLTDDERETYVAV
jgi:hypothetical protein